MKVPYSWLRELVPGLSPDPTQAATRLSTSGTYVEAIEEVGVGVAGGEAFRVGRVLEFGPHPDADKLRLVQVDVGEGSPRQVVCGASNFSAGDTVAVVLPGGRMPDGTKIREAKLRGVESRGMMLSERELGLSTDHAGIMVLPAGWTAGARLDEHLPIGDHVLELEVTGNRPDCLGMLGVAREVAAALSLDLAATDEPEPAAEADGDVRDHVTVELQATELCPRYMARAFVDVRVGPSPAWLKARLARAGMRSINNVVDVTNYVMLLTAQPLHAFDADRIAGGRIVVRRAHEDEAVTTLDDVERTLDPSMLVIADAERPAVIAGIMGAADVEVTETTMRVVLEAACFDGLSIQQASRRLALRSESSSRFEKGLDPHSPEVALLHATRLLVQLCGARLVPGTIDERAPGAPAQPPSITMPASLPGRILGLEVDDAGVVDTLSRLGFEVERAGDSWSIQVPHARMHDVTRPIDVVEEIGRFRLDQLPSTVPAVRSGGAMLTSLQRLRRLLEDTGAGLGLHEVVTYGLVAPGTGARLDHDPETVLRLANPMTADHAELRVGLLPGHLEVVRRNHAAGSPDVAIFEVGRTFHAAEPGATGEDGLPRFSAERDVLALLVTGSLGGSRWDLPGVTADFPAAAGLVRSLLGAAGIRGRLVAMPNPPTWLHPGQAAQVHADGGGVLGWIGTVHPLFAREHGVDADLVAAHLDLHALDAVRVPVPRFSPYSEYPPVLEDIAVVVADGVAAGEVVEAAWAAGGELLESVDVFDRYVGEPVPQGHHSLALRLVFRASDRTLTDADTAAVRGQIVGALERGVGAQLRS